jgi:hypothetical protein
MGAVALLDHGVVAGVEEVVGRGALRCWRDKRR